LFWANTGFTNSKDYEAFNFPN